MSYDPRGDSPNKLPTRAPLPMISRKALRRVKDWLPPPTTCPCCGQAVELINNCELYGRSFGEWPYMYICFPCDTYVGTHKYTDLPLGTMAGLDLRYWRKRAKGPFLDKVRDFYRGNRNQAYQELANAMGIPRQECHFGMFSIEQCQSALRAMGYTV